MDLVLHIGIEKTGTTLIQHWLYSNRQALAAQGIALSDVLGKPNNRLLAARLQGRLDDLHARLGLTDLATRDRHFHDLDARFTAELAQMQARGARVLVVSSEHLSSRMSSAADLHRLRDWLSRHFSRICVTVYLREQAALNRSLYSTAILNGQTRTASEFADNIQTCDPYYNFDLMLGLWADVLRPDRLDVAIYDPRHFVRADLRRDFLARALPGVSDAGLSFPDRRINKGITGGQAAIMRRINRAGLPNLPRRMLCELVRYLPLPDDPPDLPQQAVIHAAFDASNRAMAARHFGAAINPFQPPVLPD